MELGPGLFESKRLFIMLSWLLTISQLYQCITVSKYSYYVGQVDDMNIGNM